MSAALETAVRARFAAAVAWARRGDPDRVHAILVAVNGPQDGQPRAQIYSSDDPNGPFLSPEQSTELADALDTLDARLDALATDAAETLRQFAGKLIPDEETRAEVLDDPRTAKAAQSGDAFLDALHAVSIEAAAGLPAPHTIDRENLGPDGKAEFRDIVINVGVTWPGDVTSDDALAWLGSRLKGQVVENFRRGLAAGLYPGHPALKLVLNVAPPHRVLTFGGAAVLFSVEKSLDDPLRVRRPFAILADVSPASRVAAQSLAAVDVREHGPRDVQDSGSIVPRELDGETLGVSIVWHQPRRRRAQPAEIAIQLRLPGVDWTMLDAVLSATREEYGVEVAATLLGVSAFSFLQDKRAGDSVMLYPEELARATGRRDDKDYRKRLRGWLDALASARIVTRFRGRVDLECHPDGQRAGQCTDHHDRRQTADRVTRLQQHVLRENRSPCSRGHLADDETDQTQPKRLLQDHSGNRAVARADQLEHRDFADFAQSHRVDNEGDDGGADDRQDHQKHGDLPG